MVCVWCVFGEVLSVSLLLARLSASSASLVCLDLSPHPCLLPHLSDSPTLLHTRLARSSHMSLQSLEACLRGDGGDVAVSGLGMTLLERAWA